MAEDPGADDQRRADQAGAQRVSAAIRGSPIRRCAAGLAFAKQLGVPASAVRGARRRAADRRRLGGSAPRRAAGVSRHRARQGRVAAAGARRRLDAASRATTCIAEALARQVALAAGQPASFDGRRRGDDRQAERARACPPTRPTCPTRSGLSRHNRISPTLLTDLLALAAGRQAARSWPRCSAGCRWPAGPARCGPGSPRPAQPGRPGPGPGQDRHADRGQHDRRRAGHQGRPAAGLRDHGGRHRRTSDAARAALDRIAAKLVTCGCRLAAGFSGVRGVVRPRVRWVSMAQFVDWDLAAATAGALSKSGPAVSYEEATQVVARAARAHRRGRRSRRGVHGADRAGRAAAGAGGRPQGLGGGQHRRPAGGDRPAGQPALRRQAAGRVRRRDRLPGDRGAGRHGAGLPVRPGPRPVRGVLRRPGPAAARRAEHRRGRAQDRRRPARLPALGLPARGHPPHPVHRGAVDARLLPRRGAGLRRRLAERRAHPGAPAARRRHPVGRAARPGQPLLGARHRPDARRRRRSWTG